MIGYHLGIKKFLNSQYLYTGVRITAGVLIPAMVLYHYGLLGVMMGIPLGALFIALPDNPGPLHHRINGMIAGIFINFVVVIIAGYSTDYHWVIGIEIVVFSFLFAMFGIYGARADGVGLMALVAFIISYGAVKTGHQLPIYSALYFAAGGAWYAVLTMVFSGIQPYRPVQQLLGEYLSEIGEYLAERSGLYDSSADVSKLFAGLLARQARIQKYQADLREMLFKTRLFVKESTDKGRRLVMIFLESTDLLERIITAQQNYKQLHHDFDDSDILQQFRQHIHLLGGQLQLTGAAIQAGDSFSGGQAIDANAEKASKEFFQLRDQKLNSSNIEPFIRLRHILYSVEDISQRIKRLQAYTLPDTKIRQEINPEYLQAFVTHQDFSSRHLTANLSLNSGQFRHAIRLTAAMVAAYLISLLLPLGHGYWILLSVATILKPAFSASRKRNIQRVTGTLVGVGMGFLTLYLSASNTPVFVVMIVSMLIAYTSLRLNYMVSTAAITLYVVLSFHFFYEASLNGLLIDRVIDTIAGGLISLAAAYFILPKWEHEQISDQLKQSIADNNRYFRSVAAILQQKDQEKMVEYKLSRKAAFVSLANLGDGLQRMLDEPKSRQRQLPYYHQLVASNHMLTSYIASLAYYAGLHGGRYDIADLKPMLQYICRQFDACVQLSRQPGLVIQKQDPFPVNKKMQQLLQQRRNELAEVQTRDHSMIRHEISLMKALSDQLQLINSVLEEEMRLLVLMSTERPPG
jgi:uncharacterized membrane protein (TIGR01666 family)